MVKKLLIGLIVVFLLSSLIKSITEYRRNLAFYATYKKDFEAARKRNNYLKMEAIKQADPWELEKTIRNNLGFLKDNEFAVIVPTPTTPPTTPTPTPLPVYRQWVKVFFQQ